MGGEEGTRPQRRGGEAGREGRRGRGGEEPGWGGREREGPAGGGGKGRPSPGSTRGRGAPGAVEWRVLCAALRAAPARPRPPQRAFGGAGGRAHLRGGSMAPLTARQLPGPSGGTWGADEWEATWKQQACAKPAAGKEKCSSSGPAGVGRGRLRGGRALMCMTKGRAGGAPARVWRVPPTGARPCARPRPGPGRCHPQPRAPGRPGREAEGLPLPPPSGGGGALPPGPSPVCPDLNCLLGTRRDHSAPKQGAWFSFCP